MMGMDLVYSSINITTDTLIFPLTGFQNLVEIEDSMDEARMVELTPRVKAAAMEIGAALGFNPARLGPGR